MDFPKHLSILFIVAFLLFVPAGLLAQTYQELDAEAAAAEQRLWGSAFIDPIGKKVYAEFDAGEVSANSAAVSKVYEIEQLARINEIAARTNKAYSTFQVSTGSGRTLKQKCDATSTFYSALANKRGKLISLGGNIAHGTKVREHSTNTLNSIDNAMKLVNSGLSAC